MDRATSLGPSANSADNETAWHTPKGSDAMETGFRVTVEGVGYPRHRQTDAYKATGLRHRAPETAGLMPPLMRFIFG